MTQLGLGIVAQRTADRDAAARHYQPALKEAADAQIVPVVLPILAVAELDASCAMAH